MDVSTSQAANLLQVAKRTIQFYVRTGKLPARRRGLRRFVFDLDELRSFAASNQMIFDEELANELQKKG